MEPLKIRIYDDPCLRKKALTVSNVGPAERMLISAMIETMYAQKGIGLAAPQVGISQKIFVIDTGDGPQVFVNPRIVKKQGSSVLEEGCLSLPGVTINIKRPAKVLVRYKNEDNREQERVFEDLMARVIQHENDHLSGKLIIDYATRVDMEEIKEKLEKLKQGIIEIPEKESNDK